MTFPNNTIIYLNRIQRGAKKRECPSDMKNGTGEVVTAAKRYSYHFLGPFIY